jgi:hypothetical protein
MKKKLLCLLLAVLMILPLFTACSKDGKRIDIVKNGTSDYTIILPEDKDEGNAAIKLLKAIEKTTGVTLPYEEDIFSSEDQPKSAKEILVGQTNRAASEEALAELSVRLRNMKDENGEPLGYTADTIILPGNRPAAEMIAKKVCGSEGALGNGYNDINLHFGNWNVVIMPGWQTEDDRCMIMSSEANRNLAGNLFFNRVPLTVTNWVDNHTGNYIWNGRCRFGVGFGTYKHILLAVDSASAVAGATQLA